MIVTKGCFSFRVLKNCKIIINTNVKKAYNKYISQSTDIYLSVTNTPTVANTIARLILAFPSYETFSKINFKYKYINGDAKIALFKRSIIPP